MNWILQITYFNVFLKINHLDESLDIQPIMFKMNKIDEYKLQSRKLTIIETSVNVGSGYFIAMLLNLYFLPHFAAEIIQQSLVTAAFIGLIYTGVSWIRSFICRVVFKNI